MQPTALPLLANRYELVRNIGSGGMGAVWLARDSSLDRPCAVKLLDDAHLEDEEILTRFRSEARSTACIRSPHVVEVFDHGTWCGVPFIVMEFLAGEDLGTRLRRVQRLDLPTTYEIVRQLASGLSSAHGAGIVHRDLKPANVLLARVDGREIAKIIDFGIANNARVPGSTLIRGLLLGTPEYMSPEQARGLPIDARTDVFSLGVLVYECLSGQTPSDREHGANDALHEGIPKLAGTVPGIPSAFDSWVARALARDRERRFQSAKELADALGQLIGGHASLAPAPIETASASPDAPNDSSVWPRTCSGAPSATQARCATDSIQGRDSQLRFASAVPSRTHRSMGVTARRLRETLPWYGAALVLPAALGAIILAVSSQPSGSHAASSRSLRGDSAVFGVAHSIPDGFGSRAGAGDDRAESFTAEGSSVGTSERPSQPKPIVTPDPTPLDSYEPRPDGCGVPFRKSRLRTAPFKKVRSETTQPASATTAAIEPADATAAAIEPADATTTQSLPIVDANLSDRLAGLRRYVVVSYARAHLEFAIPMLAATPAQSALGPTWSHDDPEF